MKDKSENMLKRDSEVSYKNNLKWASESLGQFARQMKDELATPESSKSSFYIINENMKISK